MPVCPLLLSPSQVSVLRVRFWSSVFIPAGQAHGWHPCLHVPITPPSRMVPTFPRRHLPFQKRVTKSPQAPAEGKAAPIGSAQRSGLFRTQLAELSLYKVGVDYPSPHCPLSGTISSALPFLLHQCENPTLYGAAKNRSAFIGMKEGEDVPERGSLVKKEVKMPPSSSQKP